MAATSIGRSAMDPQAGTQNAQVDRLKALYPMVNEEETPLPRSWSPKDKYNYIGLSQNNLRVHYKGKCLRKSVQYFLSCEDKQSRSSLYSFKFNHSSVLSFCVFYKVLFLYWIVVDSGFCEEKRVKRHCFKVVVVSSTEASWSAMSPNKEISWSTNMWRICVTCFAWKILNVDTYN